MAERSVAGPTSWRNSESLRLVERPAVELLAELGWTTVDAREERFRHGGTLGRDSRTDVVLTHRLRAALARLNPDVPEDARTNALGAPAAMRTRARVEPWGGVDVCRVDVPASSRPVRATTSGMRDVFFVRMNNSTRVLAGDELDAYVADRWPVP